MTPAHATATAADRHGALILLMGVLGCGLLVLGLPPVPDHAYQFHLAGRVLDGARLYVDAAAADMHPPLFTWLAMALESVGRAIGVPGLDLFPLAILATVVASLLACWRIGPRSLFLFAVLAGALLPLAGPYFGQGEHIALALALPWLFLAAAGADAPARGRPARLLIAAAAALGLAMKPHFALVWVAVEARRALRDGPRSLLRIENACIALLFTLYLAATALLAPEFFRLLPWLMALYPRFVPATPVDLVLDWRTALLVAGLLAARVARRDGSHGELPVVLALAALAMYAAMLLQLKGWGYQWYPVTALAFVLVGMGVEPVATRFRATVPALAVASVAAMSLQVDRTIALLASPPAFLPELLRIADERARDRPIVALSRHIHAAFPLVNLTGSVWRMPYAHLWMVPGVRAPDALPEARRVALEREILDRVWATMEADPPALLIVEAPIYGQYDMRGFFEADARYRRLFAAATVLDTVGYYVVYRPPPLAP